MPVIEGFFLSHWYVRVAHTQNILKRFLTAYLKISHPQIQNTVKERNLQRGALAPSTGEDANILKCLTSSQEAPSLLTVV